MEKLLIKSVSFKIFSKLSIFELSEVSTLILRDNLIDLKAPDIAENGNTVPISFSVKCSMKGNDFPKTVHILVLDNPFPEIAKFYFTPSSGEANVSIRIRMRTSSNIVAIAEMADGTVGETRSYVDVTIGACS